MRRLSSLGIYNMPNVGRNVSIELKPDNSFLILTGYNGSGKSRVISSLLETLAMVRDHDYSSIGHDWVMSVKFEDGIEVRSIKMDRGNIPHEKITSKIGSIMSKRHSLSQTFNEAETFIKSGKDKTLYSGSKSDNETRNRSFCGAILFDLTEPEEEFVSSLGVVAYINDNIYFNHERKLENAVLKRGVNLDDTLLVLTTEFISSSTVKEVVKDKIEHSVQEIMTEYLSLSKKNKTKASETNAIEYVAARINAESILQDGDSLFSRNELFVTLNKFFKTTKRKLVWRNNMICLELSDGLIVEWFYFSKGEKALLALFLMVYLYRDSSIFLLDEPEVSLHVEWQKMIFPALQSIAPNSQFIVATHSPFLVMNTGREQIVNMAKFGMDTK